jgi:glutathione synthase/RimK-type ligase-like ATP-grasp enzyme
MSDPRRLEESSYKVEQMRRAASLGLRLPRTLVTNDPVRLRDFHADCAGEIVHKTLAAPLMGVDSGRVYALDEALPATVPGLLTRRVTAEHLAQSDRVALMPSFFQELVAKRTELRVTVFEDQIFTAVLHSQDDERTAVDWRHHEVPFRYSSGVLPDDVARKCLALMRSYELTFGTFDFIVTPEGEHVFLEMNPNGQWMFVQQRLPELTMAQTLVDILLRNAA